MKTEDEETTLPPPSTKPSSPGGTKDFTPEDFARALDGSFKKVRDDVSAQIGEMASELQQHAAKELTQLELIAFNVATIQKDIDTLSQNYKDVNLRLTGHDSRIGKLEEELAKLKRRADELQREILELKASSA